MSNSATWNYEIYVRVLPFGWWRSYKVVGHTTNEQYRTFTLFFGDGQQLVFPLGRVTLRLTRSWFDFTQRQISREAGQQVVAEPK